MRVVGEMAADAGVGGGRRGGGRGRVDEECGFCVLPALFTYYLDESSKNLETFQETSSRLPGTPLPIITGLVVDVLF